MGYYISYIVSTKKLDPMTNNISKVIAGSIGHVSLGITQYDPTNKDQYMPVTLFRVGLFESGQVLVEDKIIWAEDPLRTFSCLNYPISTDELGKISSAINQSREENIVEQETNEDFARQLKKHDPEVPGMMTSNPGGPTYSLTGFNCKTYALNILKKAGIDTSSFENIFFDMPTFSGELHSVTWEEKKYGTKAGQLIWNTPMHISSRSMDHFTDEERENYQWEKIFSDVQIKVDEYLRSLFKDAMVEVMSGANENLLTGYRQGGPQFVIQLLIHNSDSENELSPNLQIISKKYKHFDHVKNMLNNGCGEDEKLESPVEILSSRLHFVADYLRKDEVKNDLAKYRGFSGSLYNLLGIPSTASNLSLFIQRQASTEIKTVSNNPPSTQEYKP